MKQYNQVLNKFGRAGLVALFATGLAFAGATPAVAMSGTDFKTSDLGNGGNAVARLEISDSEAKLSYRSCTGVLVSQDEVLTSSACFSFSNDPYKDVRERENKTMFALAQKTARVTFGNTDTKNAKDNVYFSVSSRALDDPDKKGLALVKLDRPVTSATPVSKVSSMAHDGQQLTLVGWETTDFVPAAGSFSRTLSANDLRIALRHGDGAYYTSPQTWDVFVKNEKSMPKLDIPSNDKDGVVPAFRLTGWRPAKVNTRELGAPVLDSSGALQGLLVGYNKAGEAVFIDMGEPNISDKAFKGLGKFDIAKEQPALSEEKLAEQLINLRKFLCSKPSANIEDHDYKLAEKEHEAAEKSHNDAKAAHVEAEKPYLAAKDEFEAAELAYKGAEAAYKAAEDTYNKAVADYGAEKIDDNAYNAAKEARKTAQETWSEAQKTYAKAQDAWREARAEYKPAKDAWDVAEDRWKSADEAFKKIKKPSGSKVTSVLAKYDDLAAKNATVIKNLIKAYNDKKTQFEDVDFKEYEPAEMHAPLYPGNSLNKDATSPLDPQYIAKMSLDGDSWTRHCESKPNADPLDMATLYREAVATRKAYDTERSLLDGKLKAAEAELVNARRAFESATNDEKKKYEIHKVDITDKSNKKIYEDAKAETKKAKALYEEKSKAYDAQKELNDSVGKQLDPVMKIAEDAVNGGLSTVADMVNKAQKSWEDQDNKKLQEFTDALDKHLRAKEAAYRNKLIDKDNAAHPQVHNPNTGKMEYPEGYPRTDYETVDTEALNNDPQNSYLASGTKEAKVDRDLEAYYEYINEAVPILLEARYQIWNMQRMKDMLQKGAVLNDADKIDKQEQILDILKKKDTLRTNISPAYAAMQKAHTDLEALYKSLPQSVQQQLDKKGYPKAMEQYTSANSAYSGAEADLANLAEVESDLANANTAAQMDSLLEKASSAFDHLKNILEKITTATEAMNDLRNYGDAVHDGNIPDGKEKPDPTWGMTPDQKKAWDEMQKAKEEAEKKAKELQKAEDDKKKPGNQKTEADKKKAEEEKKKADDEAKKDEARLAKALSKNTLRAEGTDRVLTSIAAWKIGKFPGDSLVLVDGNVHADGLSATPFAAALKAPVLLTCWNTGLEPALMDQIKASGKKKLFLVGGQVPMTPYDEFELRDAGLDIFRIAGPDRYATSVAVNQATEPLIGAKPKKPINLYIGDGVGFPDALVAGAAAGRVGGLMLLSKGKQLDPQTYNYISNLGQTRPLKIIPVGGPATAAVKNTPWPTTMSINIAPIVGKDRYETAAKLATTLPGTRAAVLATGENFADALSGGPLAVDQNATLVLTRSQELPPASYQSLQRFGFEKTIVMGGKSAVSPKVAELINGATLKNTDTKTVLGTLLERKKLRDDKANQEAKERRNALSTVRGMIKDSNSLKDVMSQLGFGSIDDLTKLLNDFKAQQDKDKKPDTAKPELDKSSTTTGK
ncbi:trypsin [Mobiluncus mulieris ATCC 35239]|uniref:Trypsin n=2 Tax=Mobiluncus mulieris TaxID=2052 RepID=E0QPT9_9ACTO|nr:cell wall-binding repeat-containing protein [Mobiluncus mulieris]EFM46319.1 trypsin [Mobiluncus mulieris ATCC 35239]MCU9976481.1 trypsin-like serine protease [Mobiluncus mulieris]MCU9993042.1 trypsin-like serine protease [Mobiluncus mulieris]MCV0014815.1 trypsin-like serine protease [Mobiluncus mulieris]NMW62881.1 trypsin-like serine protease [Mobiluncus mulieris]